MRYHCHASGFWYGTSWNCGQSLKSSSSSFPWCEPWQADFLSQVATFSRPSICFSVKACQTLFQSKTELEPANTMKTNQTTVGPRARRCIGTQMCYVVVWFADAKDLHEYVHENVIWDHVNILYMCRCQDKMWRCQGFSCKKQTRYVVCEKQKKHTDMTTGSQTQTHAEKHVYTNIYIQAHKHKPAHRHTEAFTHRSLYTQKLLHTEVFTHKSFYAQTFFTHRGFYTQTLLHTNAFTHS